jgi:hypothetical protein|tara:strand:+ start:2155 stop:2577 length:423 start_codon:yes stop_codon:yes gene_type:complete
MPINSRTKGAAFERLIVNKINECLEEVGVEDRVSRNFDQSWKAGLADIYFKNFCIECKRYGDSKTNQYKEAWWQQVLKSAGDDFIPILIYKFNQKPIYCVVPLWLFSNEEGGSKSNDRTANVPLEDLCERLSGVISKSNG